MSQGGLIVAVLVLLTGASCTIPNPRLCKNDPSVCDMATPDLATPDLATPVDLTNPADLLSAPCSADMGCDPGFRCDVQVGKCLICNTDSTCGPTCSACAGTKLLCRSDGTACAECRMDSQCVAPGKFCSAGTCQPCATADHCGPMCSVCSGSASPLCVTAAAGCGCVTQQDCGGTSSDSCVNNTCHRTCALAKDCTEAPNGKACLGLIVDMHCGCNSNSDCRLNSTCNIDTKTCVCGSTVCKFNQTCKAGACQ